MAITKHFNCACLRLIELVRLAKRDIFNQSYYHPMLVLLPDWTRLQMSNFHLRLIPQLGLQENLSIESEHGRAGTLLLELEIAHRLHAEDPCSNPCLDPEIWYCHQHCTNHQLHILKHWCELCNNTASPIALHRCPEHHTAINMNNHHEEWGLLHTSSFAISLDFGLLSSSSREDIMIAPCIWSDATCIDVELTWQVMKLKMQLYLVRHRISVISVAHNEVQIVDDIIVKDDKLIRNTTCSKLDQRIQSLYTNIINKCILIKHSWQSCL